MFDGAEYDETVRRLEAAFWTLFRDRDQYKEQVRRGLNFIGAANIENKIKLLELSLISEEVCEALISNGGSYKPGIVHRIWERLVRHEIAVQAMGSRIDAFVSHHLAEGLIWEYLITSTFSNLFYNKSNFQYKYAGAIVAIDVYKGGVERRGSGFIVGTGIGFLIIVTYRHNIDPNENIIIKKITNINGDKIDYHNIHISESYDIAAIEITVGSLSSIFNLKDECDMFDYVYTLGFPLIPCAEPAILGHRGEVNGKANLYIDKCEVLIISNLVSPGSSGCPVLNDVGRCVGMTIRWLESKNESQIESNNFEARFSAAIPAKLIREFLVSQKLYMN